MYIIFLCISVCGVCIHVEVGCFSAITYSFVLSFLSLCLSRLLFCFSACLSVCPFPLRRLISPLMIYNMTLDLSPLPFSFPSSVCSSALSLTSETKYSVERCVLTYGGLQVICSGCFLCSVRGMSAEIGMVMV